MKARDLLPLCFVLLTSGCSTVTAKHVAPEDTTVEGVRYWMSSPFLLVHEPIEVSRTEELLGPFPADLASREAYSKKPVTTGAGEKPKGDAKPTEDKPVENGKTGPAPVDEAAKAADSGGVSIVWLPDYCQQYAVSQQNFLSTQTLSLEFAGSQLLKFNSQMDSTAVANKVLDTIGGIVTSAKSTAEKAAASATQSIQTVRPKTGSMPPVRQWKRVTVEVLPPGIYPLVSYDSDQDCEVAKISMAAIVDGENKCKVCIRSLRIEQVADAANK